MASTIARVEMEVVADPHLVGLGPVARELERGHVVGLQARAEALGLIPEVLHEVGAHDPVREARIVLDIGGLLQQPAPGEALDHERLQLGARHVERCGVPSRPAADDDCVLDPLFHYFIKYSGAGLRASAERCGAAEDTPPHRAA